MIPNIIIPTIIVLTVIVSFGSVALSLFSGKKRQGSSYDFRADDDMLALAPHLVSAPLVQRRRFESQVSYRTRLTRAENQKKIEEIDKSLERIDENNREIKRMIS